MHQDQRIGLALAVLLVGAAGAFFFRNDPKPSGSTQRLKSARILDARIEEMQNAPYLSKRDVEQETPRHSPKAGEKTGNRLKSDSSSAGLPRLDGVASLNIRDSDSNGDASVDVNQDLGTIPVPLDASDRASQKIGSSDRTMTLDKESSAVDRLYVVQKGDTLSSIATRELGSSGRFAEIFDANREILKDANDLQVGMSLRIPVKRTAQRDVPTKRATRSNISAPPLLPSDSNAPTKNDSSMETGSETKSSDGPPGSNPASKKFEPVSRVPLGVRGMITGPDTAEITPKPIRKLSQLPPKDAGGKVAR